MPTILSIASCRLTLTLAMLTITMLAGFAVAQQLDWAKLELEPEQAQKIQNLEQEWRQTYRLTHPQLNQKRQALRDLMSAPEVNPSEVMSLQHEIEEHERFLREQATRIFMEKKKTLNPQQRKNLRHMMHPSSASR